MTTDRQDTVQAPKTEVDPQGILEQMQIAIVTAKSDGAIVTANKTAAQLFGVPRADLIGRSLATLVAERHRDSLRNLMRSVTQASPGPMDLTAVHQNGHEFCVRLGLTSAPAKQGGEVLATIMEIPSSALPDKIASEDRRVLETLLGNLSGMIYRCRNDESWSTEYVSDGCEALTGYAPSDFIEQRVRFADLIHPDDRAQVWGDVQAGLAEQRRFQVNYRLITADGTQKSVREQGCGVYDSQGNVGAIESFVADISERDCAERAYRDLLDAAPDGIVLVNASGTITLVNKQTELLFGYDRTELIDQSVEQLVPDRFQRGHRQGLEGFFANPPERSTERILDLTGRRKDGTELALEIILAPVRQGKQHLAAASIRDRSERLAGQKELRESEQRYQALANVSPVGIFRTDAQGNCVYVNERWSKITGLAPELASGTGWTTALDPRDRKRVAREWECATRKNIPFRAEYRFLRPTGEETWVYGQATQETDGEGGLAGFVGTITDITPLKLADREIRESGERFRQLVDNINQVFWITDWKKCELLYISPAYARIYGRSCESLHADRLSWHEVVHPEDREQVVERSTQSANLGKALEQEYRLLRDDGELRWVRDVTFPVFDEQGVVDRVIGIVNDITERKQVEIDRERLSKQLRQAQKMEAVGNFATGVAHDFNNVLTAISGYAEVAKFTAPEGIITESLDGIAKATAQAVGITRSLMTFSHKSTIPKSPVVIGSIVQETVDIVRQMIPTHTTITTRISDADSLWVSAEQTQIQQVIMNLAINARDAMPTGGEITISVSRGKTAQGEVATLEVADTGLGMSRNVVEHLFEPFFTTKPRGQGTGLGMAIVHGVVKNHDGDIHVATSPDQGTSITITLPTCAAPVAAPPDTVPPRRSPVASRQTVLLAEDNEQIRSVATLALRDAGFEVIAAATGTEAVELFEEHGDKVELLVLDVDLPGRTGISCLEMMRNSKPNIGAVIITGNSDFARTVETLDHVTLLLKPFALSDLVGALHAISSTKPAGKPLIE